jgi:hypothetical protein
VNIKATYHFVQFRFEKEPLIHHVPCEVIKGTEKRYYIKVLASNVRGRKYGDKLWVNKNSVSFPKAEVDTTKQWWQN